MQLREILVPYYRGPELTFLEKEIFIIVVPATAGNSWSINCMENLGLETNIHPGTILSRLFHLTIFHPSALTTGMNQSLKDKWEEESDEETICPISLLQPD